MWVYAIPRGHSVAVPSASTSREKSEVPELFGEEGAKQSNRGGSVGVSITFITGHWGQNGDSSLIKCVKLAISCIGNKKRRMAPASSGEDHGACKYLLVCACPSSCGSEVVLMGKLWIRSLG